MKWIFKNYKHAPMYFIGQILKIIGDTAEIIAPILLGVLVDEFIKNGAKNVLLIGLSAIAVTVLGSTLYYIGAIIGSKYRFKLEDKLKRDCYKKLNTLDSHFYNTNRLGELNTIITSDIREIGYAMSWLFGNFFSYIPAFIFVLIYFLTINVPLTLILLIPLPFIAVLSLRHIKKMQPLYDDRREERAKVNNYIQENIEGNKVVKSFSSEIREINTFKKLTESYRKKSLFIHYKYFNFSNKMSFLSDLMNLLLVLFGGLFIINGSITIGQLVIFSSLLWHLRMPITELGFLVNDYQDYKISLKKIRGLLNSTSKIKDTGKLKLNYKNEDIIFKNVDLFFDNTVALRNVSFKIKPNQTVACIGEIGSGKSSVVRLLLRFIEPTSGNIKIGSSNINDYTLDSLRRNIGYVSQTPFLFSDTIKNNVNYGDLSLSDKEIKKHLKMAKADFVFNLNDGINTVIGENGVTLSGGEKQRVSLARALARRPKILILDDITSALDIETEMEVTKSINTLDYECTKLIVAGKIFSVMNADVILVFKNNKIVEMGTHTELLAKKGEYKKLYDVQKKSYDEVIL